MKLTVKWNEFKKVKEELNKKQDENKMIIKVTKGKVQKEI